MKRCLFAVMMILMLHISAARAGAFEEGLAAALMGDYGRAFSLFQPLAREGDARAQFNLGVLYERGQSAVPNFSKTALWYRLSAEKGHAGAQTNLGALYENGQGGHQGRCASGTVVPPGGSARQWNRTIQPRTDVCQRDGH